MFGLQLLDDAINNIKKEVGCWFFNIEPQKIINNILNR
jgi:hypothetical protein